MLPDTPSNKPSLDDLDRYLAGEYTPAEQGTLESWDEYQTVVNVLKHGTQSGAPIKVDARAALERVKANRNNRSTVFAHKASWTWSIPALVAVLIIGVFAIKDVAWERTATPQSRTYTTYPAQRANVTLEDGSRVTLAPATTMRVTGRNVELHGEAVFTVNQHANSPFTIKTDNAKIRVLGTTFSVRTYDNRLRVAVKEGKVAVENVTLSGRDVAVVSQGTINVQHNVQVDKLLSWTTGELTLTGLTLAQAIPDLNRWYDADIRVQDASLANAQFEGSFGIGSRHDLAAALEFILSARVEQHGRILIVRKQ